MWHEYDMDRRDQDDQYFAFDVECLSCGTIRSNLDSDCPSCGSVSVSYDPESAERWNRHMDHTGR
jgi:hypothetical protein